MRSNTRLSLWQIYKKHRVHRGTDKGPFINMYTKLFEPYRDTAEKVFEIGVNRGGSILMWEEYFSKARVYGLDLKQRGHRIPGERIQFVQLDQGNEDQLKAFGKGEGKFDIGIDDGSHIWWHQILTFETLWPYIKVGGVYVIEDLCTSYEAWLKNAAHRDYDAKGPPSCMDYFKNMVDHLNYNGEVVAKENWSVYQRTIDWIVFREGAIFITKHRD